MDICVDVRNWLISDDLPIPLSPRMLTLNVARELIATTQYDRAVLRARTISTNQITVVVNAAVVGVDGVSSQALFAVCERIVHIDSVEYCCAPCVQACTISVKFVNL
jgi:hypothetical protein